MRDDGAEVVRREERDLEGEDESDVQRCRGIIMEAGRGSFAAFQTSDGLRENRRMDEGEEEKRGSRQKRGWEGRRRGGAEEQQQHD